MMKYHMFLLLASQFGKSSNAYSGLSIAQVLGSTPRSMFNIHVCSVKCELAHGMIKSMVMKWTIMDFGLKVYQLIEFMIMIVSYKVKWFGEPCPYQDDGSVFVCWVFRCIFQ